MELVGKLATPGRADGPIPKVSKRRTDARLPGEEDALERGGAVAHSTTDLLPLQRLARYDDEMLASVTNRKPTSLPRKRGENATIPTGINSGRPAAAGGAST